MKFDTPAGQNPIDAMRVVGQPLDRIDGPHKVTAVSYTHLTLPTILRV